MVQKMLLIDLLLLQQDVEKVSKMIIELEHFEISSHSALLNDSNKTWNQDNSSEKKRMLTEFQREAVELKSFYQKYQTVNLSSSTRNDIVLPEIGDTLRRYSTRRNQFIEKYNFIRKNKEQIAVKIAGLKMFQQTLDEDELSLHDTKDFYSILGTIHTSNLPILQHEFNTKFEGTLVSEGHVNDSEIVFISVPQRQVVELKKILERLYFINYGLPSEFFGEGTINMMYLGLEYTMACDEEDIVEQQIKESSTEILSSLENILASLNFYQQISTINSSMRHLGNFVVLTGWIPAKFFKKIKAKLSEICGNNFEITVTDKDSILETHDVPSELDNPKILKPFEALVTLFGIPHYREIDPTIIFSILYIIMYGAMFGDVGHGLAIFILGLLGVFLKKQPQMIFGLMAWVGASSTLFGFAYGSYFGYESANGYNVWNPIWISPIHNINSILIVALFFGIGVIILSFILSIINAIRMRDWGSLIFSHKGIFAFCIYTLFLFMGYSMFSSGSIPSWTPITVGLISLFLGLERIWEAIFFGHGSVKDWWMGFFDMFEFFLSMLTNTLSFGRIGAFALTHAALMLAIFTLRDMAGGTTIAANIIVFCGNIFVIGMEGFIVGIQTLRLEYYEFFIRFFKGTGRKFNPITKK